MAAATTGQLDRPMARRHPRQTYPGEPVRRHVGLWGISQVSPAGSVGNLLTTYYVLPVAPDSSCALTCKIDSRLADAEDGLCA